MEYVILKGFNRNKPLFETINGNESSDPLCRCVKKYSNPKDAMDFIQEVYSSEIKDFRVISVNRAITMKMNSLLAA